MRSGACVSAARLAMSSADVRSTGLACLTRDAFVNMAGHHCCSGVGSVAVLSIRLLSIVTIGQVHMAILGNPKAQLLLEQVGM
jgi:hypothetical protein